MREGRGHHVHTRTLGAVENTNPSGAGKSSRPRFTCSFHVHESDTLSTGQLSTSGLTSNKVWNALPHPEGRETTT